MNQRPLLVALIVILFIWAGVAVVMTATDKHTSSPEKVRSVMADAPWLSGNEVGADERSKHIGEVIAQVNLLDFDQRRQVREEGEQETGRRFFESLTKEEKSRFLEETVEHHFKSVMKAFNKMPQEERRKLVNQARKDLKRNQVEGQNMQRLQEDDEKAFESMVDKGLGAYYEEASAETKMDLAPLMEEMQQRLRGFPNR